MSSAALGKKDCPCCTPPVGLCTVSATSQCIRISGSTCTPCRPVLNFNQNDHLGRSAFTVGINPPGGAFKFPCNISLLDMWVTPAYIVCNSVEYWFDQMTISYGCTTTGRVTVVVKSRSFQIPLAAANACCANGCTIVVTIIYREKAPGALSCECFAANEAKLVAIVAGSVGAPGTSNPGCCAQGDFHDQYPPCTCFSVGAGIAAGTHTVPLWGMMSARTQVQQSPAEWVCGGEGLTQADGGLCNPNLLGSTIGASWSAACSFRYQISSGNLILRGIGGSGSVTGYGGPDSIEQGFPCKSCATAGMSIYNSGSPYGYPMNVNLGAVTTNLQLCRKMTDYLVGKSYTYGHVCAPGGIGGSTCTVQIA